MHKEKYRIDVIRTTRWRIKMSLTYAEVFDFFFEKREKRVDINETMKISVKKELEKSGRKKDEKNEQINNEEELNEKNLLELLNLYIIAYGQHEGGYLDVKKALKKAKIVLCDYDEDSLFVFVINYIKTNKLKNKFYALKKYTNKEIESWVLNEKEDYDQAWHLLVSYILYQELNGKIRFSSVREVDDLESTKFTYWGKCQNVELMLWMAIVAGIEKKRVKDVLENIIDMEENKIPKRIICKEIRKQISWSNMEEKIRESK